MRKLGHFFWFENDGIFLLSAVGIATAAYADVGSVSCEKYGGWVKRELCSEYWYVFFALVLDLADIMLKTMTG